jgi:hypothetical protein
VCSTYTYRCIYLYIYRGLQAMSSASIKMMCESGIPIRFTCQARARKAAHERPHVHRQAHRGRPLAEARAGASAWDEDVHACFGLTRVAVSQGDDCVTHRGAQRQQEQRQDTTPTQRLHSCLQARVALRGEISYGAVDGKGVCYVSVVEPEARCAHEHRPVVRVLRRCKHTIGQPRQDSKVVCATPRSRFCIPIPAMVAR